MSARIHSAVATAMRRELDQLQNIVGLSAFAVNQASCAFRYYNNRGNDTALVAGVRP